MIKSIDFCSRVMAENSTFDKNNIVISITDIDQKQASIQEPVEVLRLQFYDLKAPTGDSRYDNGLFTEHHGEKIIQFLDKYLAMHEDISVMVHCEAGISRSAAVALFVHCYTKGNFNNIDNAYAANSLIIKTMSEMTNIKITIPKEKKSAGGILLL